MDTQRELLEELAWLRRVAWGLVGNDAAAADLTQEVALEALRRPPMAEGSRLRGERLRGWLWAIARRKAGRERERAAARLHSEQRASRREALDGPDRSQLQLALHQGLLAEIHGLDAPDADLIVQRYLDRKPPREIAQEMELPVPIVRKRLSRAMDRLRSRLVQSGRGSEGWSAGLCVILGGSRDSVPIAARGEKDLLRTSGGAGTWKVVVLALVGFTAGAAWLALGRADSGPKPIGNMEFELALDAPPEEAQLVALASAPIPTSEARVALGLQVPERATTEVPEVAAKGRSILRIMDEAGAPIRAARAVWGDQNSTPKVLTVDDDGVALLPEGALGWIYAGADGFENRDFRIAWNEAGDMKLELRRQRTIPGRLLIDGVAPREEVTLWEDRYPMGHWPSQVKHDQRMQAVLIKHGLGWVAEAITVGRDGRFALVTRASWTEYFLRLPADLSMVRKEAGSEVRIVPFDNYGQPIWIEPEAEFVTLYAESTDPTQARFIDGATRAPMQGLVEAHAYDGQGKFIGRVINAPLDADGGLRIPARFKPSGDADDWQLCHSYEFHLDGLVVRRSLAQPGVPEDLGTFEVPRAPLVEFQTVARSGASFEPVRAALSSEVETRYTNDGGTARLRAEIGSTVQVLAPGYGLREIIVALTAAGPEPQIVELEPAARLRVRFDLGDITGFVWDRSVRVSLMFHGPALAGLAPRDSRMRYGSRLHRFIHGAQFLGRRPLEGSYDDAVHFQGLPGRNLWIDGLLPTSRFDVIIHDKFDGVLAQQPVVMPPAGDNTDIQVDFGDLYEGGAASVVANCRWPSSGRPFRGWVYMTSSATGIRGSGGSFDGGPMKIGPLATGRYRIAARSPRTPREGDGIEVVLSAGANRFELDASGTEPAER